MKESHNAVHFSKRSPKKRILFFVEIIVFFTVYTLILMFLQRYVPQMPSVIHGLENVYGKYGYDLMFWGALLEGTFIVGFYVPGSLVVLLGAMLARQGIVEFPLVVLFGTLGLTVGYAISYLFGRFGWYRILIGFGFQKDIDKAKDVLLSYQKQALFFCFMMPSTASFLSTAAGTVRMPFNRFLLYSFVVQGFWSFLWGVLAYIFGYRFIEIFLQYFGFIAFAGFFLYIAKKIHEKKKEKRG